jgi:hypothetical protein
MFNFPHCVIFLLNLVLKAAANGPVRLLYAIIPLELQECDVTAT